MTQFLANSKTLNAFLFTVDAIFRQDYPPSGGTWKYAKAPSTKKTWRDSLPLDILLSALSVLIVAQSSSEIPEGLMNNPVFSKTLDDRNVSSFCYIPSVRISGRQFFPVKKSDFLIRYPMPRLRKLIGTEGNKC